jgi:hypothetical protein
MLPFTTREYIEDGLKRLIAAATCSGEVSSTENYKIRLEALKLLAEIMK